MVLLLFITSFIFSSKRLQHDQQSKENIFHATKHFKFVPNLKKRFWLHRWAGDMSHVSQGLRDIGQCHLSRECALDQVKQETGQHVFVTLCTVSKDLKMLSFIHQVLTLCCVSNCEPPPRCCLPVIMWLWQIVYWLYLSSFNLHPIFRRHHSLILTLILGRAGHSPSQHGLSLSAGSAEHKRNILREKCECFLGRVVYPLIQM